MRMIKKILCCCGSHDKTLNRYIKKEEPEKGKAAYYWTCSRCDKIWVATFAEYVKYKRYSKKSKFRIDFVRLGRSISRTALYLLISLVIVTLLNLLNHLIPTWVLFTVVTISAIIATYKKL